MYGIEAQYSEHNKGCLTKFSSFVKCDGFSIQGTLTKHLRVINNNVTNHRKRKLQEDEDQSIQSPLKKRKLTVSHEQSEG